MPDLRFALFVEQNKITRSGANFQPRHADIPLEKFYSPGPRGGSWPAESWRGRLGVGAGDCCVLQQPELLYPYNIAQCSTIHSTVEVQVLYKYSTVK